jgi:membrane protein
VDVPVSIGFRGALMAAAGFEVLKVVGSYIIAASAHSATAGPFAGLLAVLVWFQLVARFLLFCAAWMATLTYEHQRQEDERVVAAASDPQSESISPLEHGGGLEQARARRREPAVSPGALGAALVAAGVVAGAAAGVTAAGWAATRWDASRARRCAT